MSEDFFQYFAIFDDFLKWSIFTPWHFQNLGWHPVPSLIYIFFKTFSLSDHQIELGENPFTALSELERKQLDDLDDENSASGKEIKRRILVSITFRFLSIYANLIWQKE